MKKSSRKSPDRVQQTAVADHRCNVRPAKRHVPQSKSGLPLISWEDVLGRR